MYLTCFLRVAIILFSTALHKYAIYPMLCKTRLSSFSVSFSCLFIISYLFSVLCFEF